MPHSAAIPKVVTTGQLMAVPPTTSPQAIPMLPPPGLAILLVLLALAGLRYLPRQPGGLAIFMMLLSGMLVAQTLRFVADGRIDDWIGYSPAVINPPGSGSPCDTVEARLVITVTDTQTGETRSGSDLARGVDNPNAMRRGNRNSINPSCLFGGNRHKCRARKPCPTYLFTVIP